MYNSLLYGSAIAVVLALVRFKRGHISLATVIAIGFFFGGLDQERE